MLGEAASTDADAARYYAAYENAIHRIGAANRGKGIYAGAGISVKLSALHPRYSRAQRERVMHELLPRAQSLLRLAHRYDIGFNIDAEEADRLDLSLDLLEALARDPELTGWNGIGFVVQAYQRRAPAVIDWIVELGRQTGHRLMIRLVKGAYWDSEIKRAQVDGCIDYPVYTRKVHTDVCYLACARSMLAAPEAIYPQFATHNAHTIAAISVLGAGARFEYQCLYGMGEAVYEHVVGADRLNRPCRVYAPVGTYETLLAYLVRRLLENGANTSFVNRIVDPEVGIDELIADPVDAATATGGTPHPRIALPGALYADRRNSRGVDLADDLVLADLAARLAESRGPYFAEPLLGGGMAIDHLERQPIRNPADHADIVGCVVEADAACIDHALAVATTAACEQHWGVADRAACLERAADLMESNLVALVDLAVREAGKTLANAVGEVREAVDFCRYYAAQIRAEFADATHRPLGPVVCISPWNFPLAIFVGQTSAALAAGNAVLAKPAEQTPLMAAYAVRLFHDAGVPRGLLQLLPGRGETVGARLVGDPRVNGVVFTGSTEVAQSINRTLAARGGDAALIAETGGLNALIVDSSALPEQVVGDALASAFDSAGQRCSALRILCLQDEIAERTLAMLTGAMQELRVDSPARLATDIGPVIDAEARGALLRHIARMRERGCREWSVPLGDEHAAGTFVAPTVFEIPSVDVLQREVFGPVLHVVRYRRDDLPALIDAINRRGYGLTHGIHSRIDEFVAFVVDRIAAGNIYVNRNVIGAVVGVQPFGGVGLSGTGPKAGGPLYLYRLIEAHTGAQPRMASAGGARPVSAPAAAMSAWIDAMPVLAAAERAGLLAHIENYRDRLSAFRETALPGPTGERNVLALRPRGRVGCRADRVGDLVHQVALAVQSGNVAVVLPGRAALPPLPAQLASQVVVAPDNEDLDLALFCGSATDGVLFKQELAGEPGPIVAVVEPLPDGRYPAWRLFSERVVSTNTTAAGGNASLMSLEA
jgi:RHH-type proline utilization regulon transcriptional repressor/proline dehydrogenase/delta 1-pyrroline-5-carboxylate dehydrogenase